MEVMGVGRRLTELGHLREIEKFELVVRDVMCDA